MELYTVVLFVHIVSGMGMAACLATLIVAEGSARRARTPRELSEIGASDERVASFMKSLALVLLLSGLYMAYARWSVVAPWVVAALIVFVYLASSGPLVFGRRMRMAVQAATTAGAITREVRQMLNDPVIEMMGRVRVTLLALLVFLMTTKPGLTGTLVALACAVSLGVLSGIVRRPERHEAGEAI
jgi:uncharacterized membrane protein